MNFTTEEFENFLKTQFDQEKALKQFNQGNFQFAKEFDFSDFNLPFETLTVDEVRYSWGDFFDALRDQIFSHLLLNNNIVKGNQQVADRVKDFLVNMGLVQECDDFYSISSTLYHTLRFVEDIGNIRK